MDRQYDRAGDPPFLPKFSPAISAGIEIYKALTLPAPNKEVEREVFLGDVDYEETHYLEKGLDDLKKEKIITSFSITREDIDNTDSSLEDMSGYMNFTASIALVKYSPKKLESYLKKNLALPFYYYLHYDNMTQKIILNGQYILHTLQLDSENARVFEYLYKNSGKKVFKRDVERHAGKLKKRMADVIRDLKFTKELKAVFFPIATERIVLFRDHIDLSEFKKSGIDEKKLKAQVEDLHLPQKPREK